MFEAFSIHSLKDEVPGVTWRNSEGVTEKQLHYSLFRMRNCVIFPFKAAMKGNSQEYKWERERERLQMWVLKGDVLISGELFRVGRWEIEFFWHLKQPCSQWPNLEIWKKSKDSCSKAFSVARYSHPKGSFVSPTFFYVLCINDLFTITSSLVHSYADNLSLLTHFILKDVLRTGKD